MSTAFELALSIWVCAITVMAIVIERRTASIQAVQNRKNEEETR